MSAIPYYYNGPMARAAVEGGCHFSDLGGNTEIVLEQKKLHEQARGQGTSRSSRTAASPRGWSTSWRRRVSAGWTRRRRSRSTSAVCPSSPSRRSTTRSSIRSKGALDYYTTPSWVLRGGRPVQVDALSEVESVEFPPPVGTLEAFHTGGGISTLPFAYEGKVDVMEYKTLRYPATWPSCGRSASWGCSANTPIEVKGRRWCRATSSSPRCSPKLHKPNGRDLVALQVQVTGARRDGQPPVTFRLLDYYDAEHGISAMMRTTGYSLAITGPDAGGRPGHAKGVHTPTRRCRSRAYVAELGRRGIRIEEI